MSDFIIGQNGDAISSGDDPIRGRRVIKTARTLETINDAVRQGMKVVVEAVLPNHLLNARYQIARDLETGHISLEEPRHGWGRDPLEGKEIVGRTSVYPYSFPDLVAAYVLPVDLEIGEEVWLEDVIRDVVGATWQSRSFRLKSCSAIWNGAEFELQYDRDRDDPYKDAVG